MRTRGTTCRLRAAMTVATAGLLIACSSDDGSEPAATATTIVQDVTTTTPEAQVTAIPLGADDADFSGALGIVEQVASIGDQVVLVAFDRACPGRQAPDVLLASSDGSTWAPPADLSLGVGTDVSPFATDGTRSAAVMHRVEPDGLAASLAVSTDGLDWDLLPLGPAELPLDQPDLVTLDNLEFVGDQFILIGTNAHPGPSGTGPITRVAWTSPDGSSWSPSSGDALAAPGGLLDVAGIVSVGDELVALVAVADILTQQSNVERWTSDDGGTTWTLAGTDFLPVSDSADVELVDVIETDDGYVAVGELLGPDGTRTGGAAAWTSPDLAAWTAADSAFDGPTIRGLSDVIALEDGGFVVAALDDDDTLSVATSEDGVEWTTSTGLDDAPLTFGTTIVAHDGRVIVVSGTATNPSETPGCVVDDHFLSWELTLG